jgi:uncharacterized protein (DUF1778 family)
MPATFETPPAKVRSERLEARISGEKKAYLQHAAELSGRSLSDFIVDSAQAEAARVIKAHETIELNQAEQVAFVTALLNAAEPNDRLRQAAAKCRQQMSV